MKTINVKISPAFVAKFPKEYLDQTNTSYSPALSAMSKNIDLGLTPDEIKMLLPQLLNVGTDAPDFYAKVREYAADLGWTIPSEGKIISVTLNESGVPDNIIDYILYKTALADTTVAKTEEDLKFVDGRLFRFKMENLKDIEQKETDTHININKAVRIYATLIATAETDETKVPLIKQMLIVNKDLLKLSTDEIGELNKVKAEIEFKKFVDKHPAKVINTYENKESLAILAMIEMGFGYNILTTEGDAIFFDGVKIASSRGGLLAVVKNQTEIYSKLQGKLRASSEVSKKIVPIVENENK